MIMKRKLITILLCVSVLFSSCSVTHTIPRAWNNYENGQTGFICPRCGSSDITVSFEKGGFDAVSAIIGGLLLFPVGILFGCTHMNETYTTLFCNDCGMQTKY